MSNDFFNELWEKIIIVSAYRSYDYQKWIKAWWCLDNLCAKAWYSEHQTWLAVDLWDASNNEIWKKSKNFMKYYEWLNNNAYKYGFTNTYKKWIDIDWYEIEPWHWRYIWIEIATFLKENNLTLAELYSENSKLKK
jgi:D-alanyl-D-alanine carboxypeptidase